MELHATNCSPRGRLSGVPLFCPGDKSISHRYAMIASLAEGVSKIRIFRPAPTAIRRSGACRRSGIAVEEEGTTVTIHGRGLAWLEAARGRSGRGQFGLDYPDDVRTSRRAAVYEPHLRRRIAVAPAHGSGHEAARADGRAHRSAREPLPAADDSRRAAASRSITRCPWPARR